MITPIAVKEKANPTTTATGRYFPSFVEKANIAGSNGSVQGESTLTMPASNTARGSTSVKTISSFACSFYLLFLNAMARSKVLVRVPFSVTPMNLALSLFLVMFPS